MATLSRGQTFGASETITNTKLHNLIDLGSISGIMNADIAANAAIADTKLGDITTGNKVRGTAIGNLPSMPTTAGLIPMANIGMITLASYISGSSLFNMSSLPSTAGAIPAANAPSLSGKFSFTRDPATSDFEIGSFTTDGTWRDLDLSSIIGTGRRLVVISMGIQDGVVGNVFQLRTKGNSNALNVSILAIQVANQINYQDAIVLSDASGVIQYYATADTWTNIYVRVKGWINLD